MSTTSRIHIRQIKFLTQELPVEVKIFLCPFQAQVDYTEENVGQFEESAKVLRVDKIMEIINLDVILGMETYFEIYVYAKFLNNNDFEFFDSITLTTLGKDPVNSSKKSASYKFSIDYEIESLGMREISEEPTGENIFKIHKITCKETQDLIGEDEIQIKLNSDQELTKKFPIKNKWYNFKKGQTRNFYKKESPIEMKFKNEIKLQMIEVDTFIDDDLGTYKITHAEVTDHSLTIKKKGAHYVVLYTVQPIIGEFVTIKQSLTMPLTENLENVSFNPFKQKKAKIFEKLNEILLASEKLTVIFPNLSFQLNQLNYFHPEKSESNDRIGEFIHEYYEEFIENKEVQDKYIEELLHSQNPLMAYPVYPEPAYYYLKELNEKYILPAAETMPDNTMAMFVNNPKFVEAFLCGMNTEMGRELLWREYPTDSRGSYFRKFWDTEIKSDISEEIKKDAFFDIFPIHKWDKRESDHSSNHHLGENHYPGKEDLLIFVIKGELLKKYPETTIFLGKAALQGNQIKIDPEGDKIYPELSAWLSEDIFMVGFAEKLKFLTGNPKEKDPGYFLTFMNKPGENRFGSDNQNLNFSHAGEYAAELLIEPYIYGKHISQFLSGWKIKK